MPRARSHFVVAIGSLALSTAGAAGAVVTTSCASRSQTARAPSRSDPSAPPSPAEARAADEAAARECTFDAKNVTPCAQDCDRGIGSACEVVATRQRDLTRAVALHERACELREAAACVTAARMYASGEGVTPSRAKQMDLLSSACKLGDASACATPAKAFAQGSGVARDGRRATELYERACAGGIETACDALGDGGGAGPGPGAP